jgi:hypothetical protein
MRLVEEAFGKKQDSQTPQFKLEFINDLRIENWKGEAR